MVKLNSNPEILLKKRKNNELKRLEKQEQVRSRELERKRKASGKDNKFVRAETLVSNHISNEIERKRIKNISKHEKRIKNSDDGQEVSNGGQKLLFVIRVPNHKKGLKIPSKAQKILHVLRLQIPNSGVLVNMNSRTMPLLKLISPYVVVGQPSLNTVRKLFQKRARIIVPDEETQQAKEVKLDNNAVVEEQFGDDLGFVCIEDLIHEIVTLGDNFKQVTHWLAPFKLNAPVGGWGPQAKLQRLQYAKEHERKVSLAGDASLSEVNIDDVIEEQN